MRAPVETLNVAAVAVAATVTEAGTVSADDALLVKATTVALVDAFDNVTVQVVLLFDTKLAAVQLSAVVTVDHCKEMAAEAVAPFSDAVIVAV